jgi:hypothetical protein
VLAKAGDTKMERQHWIPFRQEIIRVITMLRNSNKTSIILCHEEFKTKEEKGQELIIKRTPAMDTKIKDYFGGFFTDMYRCSSSPGPQGKTKFFVNTKATTSDELKSSCGMPSEIEVTDKGFAALNQYLKLS